MRVFTCSNFIMRHGTLFPMQCPKAALFDLDDTLALSFENPSDSMLERLRKLLDYIPVALITGRDFTWMSRDFLPAIVSSPRSDRFFVLTEGAAQCFQWQDGNWKELYGSTISDGEVQKIRKAVLESVEETGALDGISVSGEQFRRKKAMVAFATTGLDASKEYRYSWDPGNVRRSILRDAIAVKLPEFDVVMGGATSIDITRKGVNKAYGVRWLSEKLGVAPPEMLYVGDALFEGGNDAVVIPTGVQTRSVSSPPETEKVIDELIAACSASK